MVLEVDPDAVFRWFEQTLANPWESFADKFPVGAETRARSEQDRVWPVHGLDGDVDGMVHLPTSTGTVRAKKRSRL